MKQDKNITNLISISPNEFCLPLSRSLTEEEKAQVIQLPMSHRTTQEEVRICKEIKRNWHDAEMKIVNILLEGDAGSGKTELAKALSSNLGLPYCKITCFADMDKSDVIGSILPIIDDKELDELSETDAEILQTLYNSGEAQAPTSVIKEKLGRKTVDNVVTETWKRLKKLTNDHKTDAVSYRFYPSEIVRAFRNGYLLEIQEPTVIRDAAVLMALNSALELDGSINLPTEVIHRHPDFVAVITTNRNYTGCRPLNEALRDRIQHTEKMDLPTKEVMIQRAMAKTGYTNQKVLGILADTIILLDKTAKANGIKGVAGMRSFFYWTDAIASSASIKESLYHKVIYKITTDSEEIKMLEDALKSQGIVAELEEIEIEVKKNRILMQ